jgi:hypothetical protein
MSVTLLRPVECETLLDGRQKHWFAKIDGQFVCRHCGKPNDPADPWDQNQKLW